MHASQGGAQHLENLRILVLMLACAAVIWWRTAIVIITIALVVLVGFGVITLMQMMHA